MLKLGTVLRTNYNLDHSTHTEMPMGYTTTFHGKISIQPPLPKRMAKYLRDFNKTRHMKREKGPYYVESSDSSTKGVFSFGSDVLDHNKPPDEQPGLWCKWRPNKDGSAIEWDGREKFYEAAEWMNYLWAHFIVLGAAKILAPQEMSFLTQHTMNGSILAVGEEANSDVWELKVDNLGVSRRKGKWSKKTRVELFKENPGKTGSADNVEFYVNGDEAMSYLVAHPESVQWGDWSTIPDDKGIKGLLTALREKKELKNTVRPVRSEPVGNKKFGRAL